MDTINIVVTGPQEITNDEYHNGERFAHCISSTSLKNYLLSPLHAKYLRENPKEISLEASIKGSVYHDLLSSLTNRGDESEFWESYFVFEAPVNPKTEKPYGIDTIKYKDALVMAKIQNEGKECCSMREVQQAKKMIEHLRFGDPIQSKSINTLIKRGKAEQSHFCLHRPAGAVKHHGFKFRTDLKTGNKIVDWKSVADDDLSDESIAKIILKFKYHISAAFYQYFEHKVSGRWLNFYWVFQSKNPPYDFRIVSASEWGYDIKKYGKEVEVYPKLGAMQLMELLREHIDCTENDNWPGQVVRVKPNHLGQRITSPSVPGWAKNKSLEYYINE